MDKLTSIKAFTRVVQDGGFAAAARELRLSRSAVSKYVIDLERDLGVQLLVRTTRVKALMLVSLSIRPPVGARDCPQIIDIVAMKSMIVARS